MVFKVRGVSGALAFFLGWEISDIREAKYHHGRTGSLSIYVVGNSYMTACKTGKKPPKPKEYDFPWERIETNFFETGWDIYEYDPTKEKV